MVANLNLGELIDKHNLYAELIGGKFGIELETHRVTRKGRLSRINHSAKLGSRQIHPYLQTDYSETQAELVTEAVGSFEEARDRLLQLQWILRSYMADDESVWPLSMPPQLKKDDLQWLDETFERTWVQDYRDWLLHKYGSTHEIMTGIHLNYSLSDTLLQHLFEASDRTDFKEFKNDVYFHIARQIVAHSWFFNYLFGAAPFNLNDSDSRTPQFTKPVRSLRTSEYGFVNDQGEKVAYDSNYVDHQRRIEQLISQGKLFSEHEIYGPVRFKRKTDDDDEIDYLEIRILDTNPFDIAGISENDLNLIHLLLIYFLISDDELTEDSLQSNENLANNVSLQQPTETLANKKDALAIMQDISQLADHFGMRFNDGLSLITDRVLTPTKTPAAKMIAAAPSETDMQAWATTLGNERTDYFKTHKKELFRAYFGEGDLAQVVHDAIVAGVRVLDFDSQRVSLKFGDHLEVVTEPTNISQLFPELNVY
ncbi:Glutamate--cysteine ligase [Weissella jogaejeotgali]|uniref:Glutamate--cysteine ligase n=1 Tax=Weissella jogaejeotgali TaxID=1631871 RepID=A0A1L6RDY3_9LACO|nr:glutamate--cysteine ligase [Weissella jogaejeotgali]APS42745.1 Glutamate--cysteine ligase [Weissella jogaejeotgali]